MMTQQNCQGKAAVTAVTKKIKSAENVRDCKPKFFLQKDLLYIYSGEITRRTQSLNDNNTSIIANNGQFDAAHVYWLPSVSNSAVRPTLHCTKNDFYIIRLYFLICILFNRLHILPKLFEKLKFNYCLDPTVFY